ncbi:uncharacterized protein BO72DRAFT_38628 [Aspergillus fijiensis CBS 313.89]|uniref:Uncharacterized protein n=1 Tax=Aspergillus fijiensis CBS 313.89 TaxID=1448319 RepID=A0A8G1RCV4_9EURO|nr:uncharacterized protein BO72DRAFT_38628 [Aspergillus fijiensis CBS 313.89]RAK70955.1 hypothetical protein BO72DRAFT_38628 [Aspergillus fijiensis CBS 313.89]
MTQQSVLSGSSSLVYEPELGDHKQPNILPLVSDLRSMKSPQSSLDRVASSGLENLKVPPALQRNDSRDTDIFQIFPMDVDNNPSSVTTYNAKDIGIEPEILRSSSISIPGSTKENELCDLESRSSPTKLTLNEPTVSAIHGVLIEPSRTESLNRELSQKPPKPPKPAFLSELEVPTFTVSEHVRSSVADPGTTRQRRKSLGTDPQMLALRQGIRAPLRLFNLSMGRYQGHDSIMRIKKPWTNQSSPSSHVLPRLIIPCPETTTYVVKDSPEVPLPAPCPIVDESLFRHNLGLPDSAASNNIRLPALDGHRQTLPHGRRSIGDLLETYIRKPFRSIWLQTKENECAIVSLVIGQRSERDLLSQSMSCSFHVHVAWPIAQTYAKSRDGLKDTFVSPYMSTAHLVRVDVIVPLLFLRIVSFLNAAFLQVIGSAAPCAVIGLLHLLLHFAVVSLTFLLEKVGVNVFIQS